MNPVLNTDDGPNCCHKCEDAYQNSMTPLQKMLDRRFIVCATCDNKRCPKATDHELGCTGSNEPGQKGSLYE